VIESTLLVIDIGQIILFNALSDNRQQMFDNGLIGTIRNTREAWKSTPTGWKATGELEEETEVTMVSQGWISTHTSQTKQKYNELGVLTWYR
jgi:hypothetical protein